MLINHVLVVKFSFAGKCFISFLDDIVNYVAWAATEIYRIINRLVFSWVLYDIVCRGIIYANSCVKISMCLTAEISFHLMQYRLLLLWYYLFCTCPRNDWLFFLISHNRFTLLLDSSFPVLCNWNNQCKSRMASM